MPIAEVLQLDVSTAFHKGGEAELARELDQTQGVVLIACEHHALCQLANDLLRRHDISPQDWPDERFDLIWVFKRAGASWNFKQVPQMLLKGDASPVL